MENKFNIKYAEILTKRTEEILKKYENNEMNISELRRVRIELNNTLIKIERGK